MSREFRRRQRKIEKRKVREKELEVSFQEYYTVDYIKSVLALHPAECVFELDAPRKITERLSVRTKKEWTDIVFNTSYFEDNKHSILQEFKNAFQQSEIYCPHEGIDRTKEVGVTVEWS